MDANGFLGSGLPLGFAASSPTPSPQPWAGEGRDGAAFPFPHGSCGPAGTDGQRQGLASRICQAWAWRGGGSWGGLPSPTPQHLSCFPIPPLQAPDPSLCPQHPPAQVCAAGPQLGTGEGVFAKLGLDIQQPPHPPLTEQPWVGGPAQEPPAHKGRGGLYWVTMNPGSNPSLA